MSATIMTTGHGRPTAIRSTAYVQRPLDEACPNCDATDAFCRFQTLFASPDHDYCEACKYYRTYHSIL